jgi:hypothetical protein
MVKVLDDVYRFKTNLIKQILVIRHYVSKQIFSQKHYIFHLFRK